MYTRQQCTHDKGNTGDRDTQPTQVYTRQKQNRGQRYDRRKDIHDESLSKTKAIQRTTARQEKRYTQDNGIHKTRAMHHTWSIHDESLGKTKIYTRQGYTQYNGIT